MSDTNTAFDAWFRENIPTGDISVYRAVEFVWNRWQEDVKRLRGEAATASIREALKLAYHELKQHEADYHHRTSTDVNNKIVDALDAAQGWRDISTAPRDGTLILICGFSPEYFVADVKWDGGWMLFDTGTDGWTEPCFAATHWQPLPTPPLPSTDSEGGK